MLHLKRKIESIMYGRDNPPVPSLAGLLHGVSLLYGAAQRLRVSSYRSRLFMSRELPCKVISIGNITVGGTGKTPMTIHVAGELKRAGFNVVIVSRGYRGGSEKHGGIVSDGRVVHMDAEQAGDEPYMIACRLNDIPVVVGKDRFAAGTLAVREFQPDVIVLDDAFQHLRLKRDIDLVLLDYRHPFGNSYLLPRGALREPVFSLARSAACILTRCGPGGDDALTASTVEIQRFAPGIPVFASSHVPYWYVVQKDKHPSFEAAPTVFKGQDIEALKPHRVFCFSGIARNDDFRQTVRNFGFKVVGSLEFSDHHPYTQSDLTNILHCAANTGADRLITTEKDHARIASKGPLPLELFVIGVKVSFEDREEDFISFILNRLQI